MIGGNSQRGLLKKGCSDWDAGVIGIKKNLNGHINNLIYWEKKRIINADNRMNTKKFGHIVTRAKIKETVFQ